VLSRQPSIIAPSVNGANESHRLLQAVGSFVRLFFTLAPLAALACTRTVPAGAGSTPLPESSPIASEGSAATPSAAAAPADSPPPVPPPLSLAERADGPHELTLAPGRPVYYARPRTGRPPWRLVGHLHGICYPPSYSCGRWLGAAVDVGVLVCPTGNAHCGDAGIGPPSWEAPTWEELVTIMDGDLERSIAKVEAKHRGSIRRDGAILTGFSRGAFAAPVIARLHPGRWPFLVLIEANVPLSAASLRKAGVRAVALVAGELGTELAGERKTEAELAKAGFPVRLFVMPRVAHLYSDDMERIMGEAFAFVLAHENDAGAP
jgi:hypothetical protein